MISASIIADSVNPAGARLTTFVLEYPRFVHAEMLTHRMFSKNAASSRAIPIEKMIDNILKDTAMPTFWGMNISGMQAHEEIPDDRNVSERYWGKIEGSEGESYQAHMGDKEFCKTLWLVARDSAISYARQMAAAGLHKQTVNRILEPWVTIRVILSGTDFQNFFALRAHRDAQPEIQVLAREMLEKYNSSTPKQLKAGEWHIPFGDSIHVNKIHTECGAEADIEEVKKKIAIARCARVSYYNFEGTDNYSKDISTCDKLLSNKPAHLSPAEHVAQATGSLDYIGNFSGFKQYRKFFEYENLKDSRVVK